MGELKTRANLEGQKFERLLVLSYSHTSQHGSAVWACKCDCGNSVFVPSGHLISGHTKSCGCLSRESTSKRSLKHGMRHTRIYRIWLNMKARCSIPGVRHFDRYGGRGIKVCDEWEDDFRAFYEWSMANGYADNLSIDRIDNNGNYEPSNCRWATKREQANNTSKTLFVTHDGETHSLKEWSNIVGVNYYTMYSRLRSGRPPEEILCKGKVS